MKAFIINSSDKQFEFKCTMHKYLPNIQLLTLICILTQYSNVGVRSTTFALSNFTSIHLKYVLFCMMCLDYNNTHSAFTARRSIFKYRIQIFNLILILLIWIHNLAIYFEIQTTQFRIYSSYSTNFRYLRFASKMVLF